MGHAPVHADNTDDELSHAAFLNAYLISRGEEPVDLDASELCPAARPLVQRISAG